MKAFAVDCQQFHEINPSRDIRSYVNHVWHSLPKTGAISSGRLCKENLRAAELDASAIERHVGRRRPGRGDVGQLGADLAGGAGQELPTATSAPSSPTSPRQIMALADHGKIERTAQTTRCPPVAGPTPLLKVS